ncbi:hypothetical protein [Halomontanus rarus]|uniref:hypothetical protein n=1 Tax=Halomontanus rarus TaxID=3034020 RepID=UPI001A991506
MSPLPRDQWDDIYMGNVVDLKYDDDGDLYRVVIRKDEHIYAVESALGSATLEVEDLGPVQGMNR